MIEQPIIDEIVARDEDDSIIHIEKIEFWDADTIDSNLWETNVTGGGAITLDQTTERAPFVKIACDPGENAYLRYKKNSPYLPASDSLRVAGTAIGIDILLKMTGAKTDIANRGFIVGVTSSPSNLQDVAAFLFDSDEEFHAFTKDNTTETLTQVPDTLIQKTRTGETSHTFDILEWNMYRLVFTSTGIVFAVNDVNFALHTTDLPRFTGKLQLFLKCPGVAINPVEMRIGTIAFYYVFPPIKLS